MAQIEPEGSAHFPPDPNPSQREVTHGKTAVTIPLSRPPSKAAVKRLLDRANKIIAELDELDGDWDLEEDGSRETRDLGWRCR